VNWHINQRGELWYFPFLLSESLLLFNSKYGKVVNLGVSFYSSQYP